MELSESDSQDECVITKVVTVGQAALAEWRSKPPPIQSTLVFEPVPKRGRPRGSKNKNGSKFRRKKKQQREPEPTPEPGPELGLCRPPRAAYTKTDWSAPENREKLEAAVDDWNNKTGDCSKDLSVREWSKLCGVPRSTLGDYISGKKQFGAKPGRNSLVDDDTAQVLVQTIRRMDRANKPMGISAIVASRLHFCSFCFGRLGITKS